MLPSTDPRVLNFHKTLQSRRQQSTDQIVESMAGGASWPKCHKDHQVAKAAIYAQLGNRLGLEHHHSRLDFDSESLSLNSELSVGWSRFLSMDCSRCHLLANS